MDELGRVQRVQTEALYKDLKGLERQLRSRKVSPASLRAARAIQEYARQTGLLTEGLKKRVLEVIRAGMNSADIQVRREVVQALRSRNDPEAVRLLVDSINHRSETVRRDVLDILSNIVYSGRFPIERIDEVRSIFRQKDWETTRQGIKLLDELAKKGHSRAIEVLRLGLNHRDDDLRWKTAVVLGSHGQIEAVPHLLDALESIHEDVRKKAAYGFAHEDTYAHLVSLSKKRTDLGRRAKAALKNIPWIKRFIPKKK